MLIQTVKQGTPVRVEIQPYWIGEVKHYRARIKGTEQWNWELNPHETLDQFRSRIMDKLGKGVIFYFVKPIKFC